MPRVKLCCSRRGGSCPGESWHHLQEHSLQGGEYPARSHLCTICSVGPGALQDWHEGLCPSCHQAWDRVLVGWEVAVPVRSVCSCSSPPWTGCLCHLPATFL